MVNMIHNERGTSLYGAMISKLLGDKLGKQFGGSRRLACITACTIVLSETFDFVGEIEKDLQSVVLRVNQLVVLLIVMFTSVLQTFGILLVATLKDVMNDLVTATFEGRVDIRIRVVR